MGVEQPEEFRHQLRRIQQLATDLWRPAPDQWSIEECLAHFTIVGQWEVPALEEAIEDARARGLTGSGPFQYGVTDRLSVDALGAGPDGRPRRRFPAPRRFMPVCGQPVTAVLPTFQHLQRQLGFRWTGGRAGPGAGKVKTPISRFQGQPGDDARAHCRARRRGTWRRRRVRESI